MISLTMEKLSPAIAVLSLEKVRLHILIALFSDDELFDVLVLKGGNALALVHHVGARASVDLDFSLAGPAPQIDEFRDRIFGALDGEFQKIGYVVFDKTFAVKPAEADGRPEWWGGYLVEFKLIDWSSYEKYHGELDTLRRRSLVVGPQNLRRYTIDISHHEFCEGKIKREVESYSVFVYSLEMIASEKLRAICQQMPEYPLLRHKRPRARDFYDIHEIIVGNGIRLDEPANISMMNAVFRAKDVPWDLLRHISSYREFHRTDWPSVEASIWTS